MYCIYNESPHLNKLFRYVYNFNLNVEIEMFQIYCNIIQVYFTPKYEMPIYVRTCKC